MEELLLKNDKIAFVDEKDFGRASQYNWYAYPSSRNPNNFYAIAHLKSDSKKIIQLHQLILKAPKGMQIDHINGNGLDNRRSNLRIATRSQNQHNQGKRKHNTSGYKGVSWNKRDSVWSARVRFQYKLYNVGTYKTAEEAYEAYKLKAKELHGEFANFG